MVQLVSTNEFNIKFEEAKFFEESNDLDQLDVMNYVEFIDIVKRATKGLDAKRNCNRKGIYKILFRTFIDNKISEIHIIYH